MIRRCRPLLGTFVEIIVPPCTPNAVTNAAFDAVGDVQRCMSFHDADSDLGRLRRAARHTPVLVDAGTVTVVRMAKALHVETAGLFDVTIGRELVRSRFLPNDNLPPLQIFTGGMDDIEIADDTHICLHRPVLIDLGGMAKGFAVDRAVDVLLSAGLENGIVNAGGDLRVFGTRPQYVHFRDDKGVTDKTCMLHNAALASSANILTRRMCSGRIITPHIGPNRSSIMIDETISVTASTCLIADALTKVAMTDPALADQLLARHRGRVLQQHDKIAA
jgi:thiamine biosynthesis lipoprotein